MKTYRPPYMSRSPIQVFQKPQTNSTVIFSIHLGEEVEIIEKDIKAIDPTTGTFYKNPIFLHLIKYDGKQGYINRRWLK